MQKSTVHTKISWNCPFKKYRYSLRLKFNKILKYTAVFSCKMFNITFIVTNNESATLKGKKFTVKCRMLLHEVDVTPFYGTIGKMLKRMSNEF
jgi:transposase-like protein